MITTLLIAVLTAGNLTPSTDLGNQLASVEARREAIDRARAFASLAPAD